MGISHSSPSFLGFASAARGFLTTELGRGYRRSLLLPRSDAGAFPAATLNVCGTPEVLERFRAKWIPVRVKKTRQNKNLELPF